MNNTLSFAMVHTLVRAALDACQGVGFQERALGAREPMVTTGLKAGAPADILVA
jgi:hypothetical protein